MWKIAEKAKERNPRHQIRKGQNSLVRAAQSPNQQRRGQIMYTGINPSCDAFAFIPSFRSSVGLIVKLIKANLDIYFTVAFYCKLSLESGNAIISGE
jgi:hypothetical protein